MKGFKDCAQEDVKGIFLNTEEFSGAHVVNGKPVTAQIDNNEQIERDKSGRYGDGTFKNQKLLYIAAEDFGKLPKQGSVIEVDGKIYRVTDAVDEDGIYSVTMEANRA